MKISPIQIQAKSASLQVHLHTDPLLITERGYSTTVAHLQQFTHGSIELVSIEKETESGTVEIVGNVAIIPIKGMIGKGLDEWEKRYFGMCDVDDVRKGLAEAKGAEVDTIILDIDSPGGFATGVHELATEIAAMNQFVVTYTEGEMASAAYYLGAGAKHVAASPTALVGSVGVYTVLMDSSQAYRDAGHTVEVIKSGALKGVGVEGTSLTDEARAEVQGIVDARGKAFREFVVANRRNIDFEHLEGQSFLGSDAQTLGFVDELASSRDELITQLVD